jgi:hypothetical protein
MVNMLLEYLGFVFIFSLIAFAAILARPEVRRPKEVGRARLLGLFVVVWAVCFVCFVVLSIAAAVAGLPNEQLFETTYAILGGIAGHFTGYGIFARSLTKRSDTNVAPD